MMTMLVWAWVVVGSKLCVRVFSWIRARSTFESRGFLLPPPFLFTLACLQMVVTLLYSSSRSLSLWHSCLSPLLALLARHVTQTAHSVLADLDSTEVQLRMRRSMANTQQDGPQPHLTAVAWAEAALWQTSSMTHTRRSVFDVPVDVCCSNTGASTHGVI